MIKQTGIIIFIFISVLLFHPFYLNAQEKPKQQGMPPAQVVTAGISHGMVAPQSEFIGTVYYQEVSDVACEVDGKAEDVSFEEGQRVEKGAVLVKLNSDLLMSDLEKARIVFDRAKNLRKEELISEEDYDERRFEKERLEIILSKKTIKAPFSGVIVKKHVERGEWLSPGSTVATIARDSIVDLVVEVPERITSFIKQGIKVNVRAGERETTGEVFAVIPRGDVSTRTIPVKVRIKNTADLVEGMEARVMLPAGQKEKAFLVPRDAITTVFGNTAVFVVIDSQAKMIPVKVVGYQGATAGIHAEGLDEGMKVVIKGNERLRDGQAVLITDSHR